jgi:hypothetical protein
MKAKPGEFFPPGVLYGRTGWRIDRTCGDQEPDQLAGKGTGEEDRNYRDGRTFADCNAGYRRMTR